jgi:hypothetical protein
VGEFNPSPRERIVIGGSRYEVMPHPAVETFAFGQEGRKAFVFQIAGLDDGRLYALKKFKLAYRLPELLGICDALAPFATIPGLEVCSRQCLNVRQHPDILAAYPDLEYAVLMPWVDGSTWYDIVVGMKPLNQARAVTLSWATATVLAALEDAGLAHCDLSSGNVIVNLDSGRTYLIDVEDLYAPGFSPPGALPAGSDGYAHYTAVDGLWQPDADRFAGAVLMAEMLAWHDPAIREAAEDEHFFSASDMQQDASRYWLMRDVLGRLDGRLVELFDQAWLSATLDECPPLFAWAEVIEELYRQARVAHVAPEWRPIVAPGGEERPAPIHPAPERERPVESKLPARESTAPEEPPVPAPEEPFPVETAPVHHDRPIDVLQPSKGGPLIGFRPIVIPPAGDRGESLPEASRRPIEAPTAPEPGFDALDMGSAPRDDEFEPLSTDLPMEETDDGASEDAVYEDAAWPETSPEAIEWAADEEPDESIPFVGEDAPEAVVAGQETAGADAPAKSGFLAGLFQRRGRKAAKEEPVECALLAPQLDLMGVDDDGRPILDWPEVPGASHYELQEAGDVAFSEAQTTRIKKGTQWQPRQSRFGTFFYRVRAVGGENASAWSNVVRVRIKER